LAPEEQPVRCLAVRALQGAAGQIDGLELEALMNEIAGVAQWMSTDEWLFIEPPRTEPDQITVPVALPESIAVKAILADLTNEPPRTFSDHLMTPGEIRKWRWLAFQLNPNPQGQGLFPWEVAHA
jgi:hypothetical protein